MNCQHAREKNFDYSRTKKQNLQNCQGEIRKRFLAESHFYFSALILSYQNAILGVLFYKSNLMGFQRLPVRVG